MQSASPRHNKSSFGQVDVHSINIVSFQIDSSITQNATNVQRSTIGRETQYSLIRVFQRG